MASRVQVFGPRLAAAFSGSRHCRFFRGLMVRDAQKRAPHHEGLRPHPESLTRNPANENQAVIARSEATKQSTLRWKRLDCFASLAMTALNFHLVDGFFSQALRSRLLGTSRGTRPTPSPRVAER